MSTTPPPPEFEHTEPLTDTTPVTINADTLDNTTKPYLRTLKTHLRKNNKTPATLTATTSFNTNSSLTTQQTINHLRDLINAAAFLGTHTLTLNITTITNPDVVNPSLKALIEHAHTNGINLTITTPQ